MKEHVLFVSPHQYCREPLQFVAHFSFFFMAQKGSLLPTPFIYYVVGQLRFVAQFQDFFQKKSLDNVALSKVIFVRFWDGVISKNIHLSALFA